MLECSSCCCGIHCVAQAALEPRILISVSQVLGSQHMLPHLVYHVMFLCYRELDSPCPAVWTRLALNSEISCLCLQSAGIKGVYHHAQPEFDIFI